MDDLKIVVAAFDFDGTITYGDSLIPFILFAKGPWQTVKGLSLLQRPLVDYFSKKISPQQVKEILITHFFYGDPMADLAKKGKAFAEKIVPKLYRKTAFKALKWHMAQGHRCIIVTAAFDFYLEAWAKKVGFEHIICSALELTPEGCLSGALAGGSCTGAEKCRRLQAFLGQRDQYILHVYADSNENTELLAMADYPHKRPSPGRSD